MRKLASMIDASELGLPGVLYRAATEVPPGRYRRIDGPTRIVDLPAGGVLPPAFDGSIALYARLTPPVRETAPWVAAK